MRAEAAIMHESSNEHSAGGNRTTSGIIDTAKEAAKAVVAGAISTSGATAAGHLTGTLVAETMFAGERTAELECAGSVALRKCHVNGSLPVRNAAG